MLDLFSFFRPCLAHQSSPARHSGRRRRSPPGPVHHQGERHQREQGEPRQRHRSRHRVQEVQTANTGQQKKTFIMHHAFGHYKYLYV